MQEKTNTKNVKTDLHLANRTMHLFVVIIGMLTMQSLHAQNWNSLDAKNVVTLIDTSYLRASEVTIMPGEMGSVHSHPAHFFYALTDCHLVVHYTDGKTEEYNMKAGDNGYSDPERPHQTENAGKKPAKFLIVELKEHPYK